MLHRLSTFNWNPTQSNVALGFLLGTTTILLGVVVAFGGALAGVALLVAGLAAWLVLRDIEIGFWGVIGVICLLPFATLPVKIGITPTFLDLALAAVVGMWALGVITGRQETVVTAPITLPLLLFTLIAIFAFIFGLKNGPLTTTLIRRFAELLLSISFVLVIVDYCRTWEQLERLVRILILAGTGAAVIGIFFWLLPDDTANNLLNILQRLGYPGGWVIRYIEENPDLAERAIGTSVDPNAFGGLLVLMGGIAAPQLVAKRPLWKRHWVVLMVGLIFAAILLTFSRGALLAAVAAVGFIALLRYRRLIPYALVLGVIMLFLPFMQAYIARFVAGIMGQDLATQMRFGEYRDAIELIGRYPLFGVGFAGSPDLDLYLGVASVYLTIGQQMGLLGLSLFLLLMGVLFGYAYFNRAIFKQSERMDPIWLGLHAAIFGGLVAGVFDHYLFNIDFHHAVTSFWLIVGLAAAATRLGVAHPET